MITCTFENGKKASLRHAVVHALVLKKDNTALIDVLKNPAFYKLNSFEKPDPFDAQNKKTVKYLCSEMYLTI